MFLTAISSFICTCNIVIINKNFIEYVKIENIILKS